MAIQERFVVAKIDDLIPSAKEIQKQAALKETQKADEHAKRLAAAEAEKRALIEKLSKPSGLSEEEKVQLASTVIHRAVRNGLTEVQIYRFLNPLCSDRGRAINQMEPGWEKTLTGIPKEITNSGVTICSRAAIASATRSSIFPAGCPATSALPSVGTASHLR